MVFYISLPRKKLLRKTKIANTMNRTNSFHDGSREEIGTPPLDETVFQDCQSNDAISVAEGNNVFDVNTHVERCGDFNEEKTLDINNDQTIDRSDKDTLINELYKSNHELRVKLALKDNKIADLMVRISAHCECCTKDTVLEDHADQEEYKNWKSGYAGMKTFHEMNSRFWRSRDYSSMASECSSYLKKTTEDILNPHTKVNHWQDVMNSQYVKDNDFESGSSTYTLKRCSRSPSPDDETQRFAAFPMGESSSSRHAPFPKEESHSSKFSAVPRELSTRFATVSREESPNSSRFAPAPSQESPNSSRFAPVSREESTNSRSAALSRAESPTSRVNHHTRLPTVSRPLPPRVMDIYSDSTGQASRNRGYQRKSSELSGNNKVEFREDSIPDILREESSKKTTETWYLNRNHYQRTSESSQSTSHNSKDCRQVNPVQSDRRDRFLDQFSQSIRQSKHPTDCPEQNRRIRSWAPENNMSVEIDQLMKLREKNEKFQKNNP